MDIVRPVQYHRWTTWVTTHKPIPVDRTLRIE